MGRSSETVSHDTADTYIVHKSQGTLMYKGFHRQPLKTYSMSRHMAILFSKDYYYAYSPAVLKLEHITHCLEEAGVHTVKAQITHDDTSESISSFKTSFNRCL